MKKKLLYKKILPIITCIFIGMSCVPAVIGTSYSKDLNQNDLNLSIDRKIIMLTGFWDPTGQMIDNSRACIAACVRFLAPSFLQSDFTCALTVVSCTSS